MPTKPADAFAALLLSLQRDGYVPYSRLSSSSRKRMNGLLEAGVLVQQRAGAGSRIVVVSREHLREYIEKEYPSGLEVDTDSVPSRASGVRTFRNSKRGSVRESEPVLLRGFNGICLESEGKRLQVAELTSEFGLAAFMLHGDPGFHYGGMLATVENLELFSRFEELDSGIDLVVYTGGRISRLLLGWLSGPGMAGCNITHYGDWDPVGLDEYLRILKACPGRTSFYLPDGLEELFRKYGKRDLVKDSSSVLGRLRKSGDKTVREVVALMDQYNAGLEQEVLLVSNP